MAIVTWMKHIMWIMTITDMACVDCVDCVDDVDCVHGVRPPDRAELGPQRLPDIQPAPHQHLQLFFVRAKLKVVRPSSSSSRATWGGMGGWAEPSQLRERGDEGGQK